MRIIRFWGETLFSDESHGDWLEKLEETIFHALLHSPMTFGEGEKAVSLGSFLIVGL